MKHFRKLFILHPYLFSLYPLVFYYSVNMGETIPQVILQPALIILFSCMILLFIFGKLLRNRYRAGLLISVWSLLFFSWGHTGIPDNSIFFPFYILLFVIVALPILFVHLNLHAITHAVNIVSILLIALPVCTIARQIRTAPVIPKTEKSVHTNPNSALPDIYYIIAERYPSEKSLKNNFRFDNSAFSDYLASHGFYIAHDSNSNYMITSLSLASSLNMNYIDQLIRLPGKDTTDKRILYDLIQYNGVVSYLKNKGYRYIHIGSNWSGIIEDARADLSYRFEKSACIAEFYEAFRATTLLGPLDTLFRIQHDTQSRENHRLLITQQVKYLKEFSRVKGPKFVFAHLFLSHPPFVFNPDGSIITEEAEKSRTLRENNINKILYANSQYTDIINTILRHSSTDPIIIIQSDEGPYFKRLWKEHFYFPMQTAESGELQQKSMILNAYHVPDTIQTELYPTISPVNTFRVIFSSLFDEKFPLLPDKTYAHYSFQKPYNFIDVTDRIR